MSVVGKMLVLFDISGLTLPGFTDKLTEFCSASDRDYQFQFWAERELMMAEVESR